ncbi:peptide ABC transporter permease [Clostridiales bacterium PH28_bin88]|nr:peptide ABC transporter permease [Clostridiales bacterium PH28_bin88]
MNETVITAADPGTGLFVQLAGFWRRFRKNRAALVGLVLLLLIFLLAALAPVVSPYNPYEGNLPQSLQGPSGNHWLGTDHLGRDILSRIFYGARISLRVGLIAVGISLAAGVMVGAVAGYYGGLVDLGLMRVMDIMMAFPPILLALALMILLGRGIENAMVAIGIVYIPEYARIVRGSVMSVKENDYVQAALALGAGDLRVIFLHVLPNVVAPIIIRATMGVSQAILETAGLGFLGLGVQEPFAEWGAMLGSGRGYFYNAPHVVIFPGLAITITVMAFNLLGDGLRDALDPRLKQ